MDDTTPVRDRVSPLPLGAPANINGGKWAKSALPGEAEWSCMVDDCSTVKFSASCDASPELPLPDGMLTQELVTAEDCSTVRLCDSVCEPSEEMCVSDGVATQLIFSGEDSSLGPRPAHDGSLTPEPVLPSQCLGWQAEPPSEGRLADVLVKLHAAEQNIPNLNAVGFLLKSPWEVSQQLNISLDDVALLYQYLSATVLAGPNTLLYPVSVAECFTSRKRSIISTGSECLDRALAGGLACGTITEVTGASGSGKTALALHLAMRLACENDTMPGPHRTLWITTDYLAFPSAALRDLARLHMKTRWSRELEEVALCRVSVTAINTFSELRAQFPALREHLLRETGTGLLVVDGLNTLVRRTFPGVDGEVAERHEAVTEFMCALKSMAHEFHLTVIVTTVAGKDLGQAFPHAVNTRLRLSQCLVRHRVDSAKFCSNDIVGHRFGARLAYVLELAKSCASPALQFELEFDRMYLKCVHQLETSEAILMEDAGFCGINPHGHTIVPTFVYL